MTLSDALRSVPAALLALAFLLPLGALALTGGSGGDGEGDEIASEADEADEAAPNERSTADAKTPAALAFEMATLDGKDKKLADYYGDVILVVNVASRCGLTPQYSQLQALHEKYAKRGLTILGFPCNQFGNQEPGSAEEIRSFCSAEYGVEFPMFAKVDVNGEKRCALYRHLTSLDTEPKGKGDVTWNFEKFLIDREGRVVGRYHPRVKPDDKALVRAIRTALEAPRPADAPARTEAPAGGGAENEVGG